MRRTAWYVAAAMAALLLPPAAAAQQVDSSRAAAGTPRGDSSVVNQPVRAPLSPRRAFIYSVLVPGSAQSILGRPNAAALFVLAEAVTITMIRQSHASAREARRLADDSVLVSRNPDVYGPPRYPAALVRAREAQVEDWIAALVANHLFAGADAFVAAHLWDVPAQLSFRAAPGHARLAARVTW